MKLIGLSGPVSVGKDTIADYLVAEHGFTKFSFSDSLYEEVAAAFGIDKARLYVRETKETPVEWLALKHCKDEAFVRVATAVLDKRHRDLDVDLLLYPAGVPLSPRQITQWWGTEYRRAQDPAYWIKKSALFVEAWWQRMQHEHPSRHVGGLVNSSVRFPNEREFIYAYGGEVWHVQRPDWSKGVAATEAAHVAERGLQPYGDDKVIVNAGTLEQLHTGTVLLLGSRPGAKVECRPVTPDLAIMCDTCGVYHREYTEQQAKAEIAAYVDYRSTIAPQAQDRLPAEVKLDDYGECHNCGGFSFGRTDRAAEDSMPAIIGALVDIE